MMQGRTLVAIPVAGTGSYRAYGAAVMVWYRAQYAAFTDPSEGNLRAADAAWDEVVVTRDAWLAYEEEPTPRGCGTGLESLAAPVSSNRTTRSMTNNFISTE